MCWQVQRAQDGNDSRTTSLRRRKRQYWIHNLLSRNYKEQVLAKIDPDRDTTPVVYVAPYSLELCKVENIS